MPQAPLKKIEISIVIVDYNASNYIVDCLKSLKQHYPNQNCEIIVVDNDSKENNLKEYEAVDSRIKTIRLDNNIGFGNGNNAGVKMAQGEYILLLNPDTLVTDDSIEKMLSFLKKSSSYCSCSHPCHSRPVSQYGVNSGRNIANRRSLIESGITKQKEQQVGIVCPRIRVDNSEKSPEEVDYYGDFPTLGTLIRRNNHHNIIDHGKFLEVERVTGACMMLLKSLYDQVGGFDENFFMYFEDTDLCKKIFDLGYKNTILLDSLIVHFGGKSQASSKQKKERYYSSQNYFFKKHYGPLASILIRLIRLPYKIMRLAGN